VLNDSFYSLPLSLDSILERKQLKRCSLKESVYQHLYLILVTHFEESRYDREYGCELWESDFSLMSQIKWKDLIRESFEKSVSKFETRLTHVKVKIELEEYEVMTKETKYVRKRLGVGIDATLRQTNEAFTFFERIFISPMSVE
jgi:predicted component of type VI protein secretion system